MTRHRFPLARVAIVLVGLASVLACSVIIDTSATQCTVDSDCPKLGASFASSVCQKNVCVVPPVVDPLDCKAVDAGTTPTVKLTFSIAYAAAPTTPAPFTILACDRLDVTCASPVAGPVTANATDPIELDVPPGFQGYLQITSDATVSAMEFLAKPIEVDTQGWNLTIATETTISELGLATGTTIDRTLGTIVMIARDCNRTPLAGVQASIDVTQGDATDSGPDTTVGFYFDNTFPTKSQTSTTSEGAAGFVNVPIGSAALAGKVVASGRMLSPTAAVSRAGWVSYVEVQP
jgi:hypothetical protein